MKKYIILFAAALAYLFLSSRSCEGPEQEDILTDEEVLSATKESIEQQFASDDLSPALLSALEIQAQQKLADFFDYLSLYTDASLDSAFRTQAHLMIRELFVSDTVQINPLLTNKTGEANLSLKDFLDIRLESEYNSLLILTDSVETVKSLNRTDKASYEGILAFQRHLTYRKAPDTAIVSVKESMAAEMIAIRVTKAIGSDTLQAWEVFLGDIR
jgi:hypothetical protein